MRVTKLLWTLALALCLFPGLAHADDEDEGDSDAARAIALSGRLGLTGFNNMVDARTPKLISIRGGARYDFEVVDRDFNGAVNATRKRKEHELELYVGASALGLIDVSARLPYVFRRDENVLKGVADFADRDRGWGDFDLAGKVTLNFGGLLSVAPFVHGRFATGEPSVRGLYEGTWGVAATLSIFNDYLAVHGNVAGFHQEEGLSALIFRGGASFVLWSDDFLLLRVYGYADGIEYEGRADFDLDIECGAQAILFGFLTAEVGTSFRLKDAGYLDASAKTALRDGLGVFDRHFEDDGTYQIHLALGVVFDF